MSFFRKIGQVLTTTFRTREDLSIRSLDIQRVALALQALEYCNNHRLPSITPEALDKLSETLEATNDTSLERKSQACINSQLIFLFERILLEEQFKSEPKKREKQKEEDAKTTNNRAPATWNVIPPFSLEVKVSSIAGAGQGVFARIPPYDATTDSVNLKQQLVNTNGKLLPGTVVALYPGLIHLKEHLRDRTYFQSILPDPNMLLMARPDQNIIDGRTTDKVPHNRLALAHMTNHCGTERPPNVLQVSYDFPAGLVLEKDAFPLHLRHLIPNDYAKPPSAMGKLEGATALMRGLVLIACRPIADGDELLMDYRLNPDANDLPEWYRSFDAAGARSRLNEEAPNFVW